MTTPVPEALDHAELHAAPSADSAAAALAEVARLGPLARDSRADLEGAIRTATAAGAKEKDIVEASGLARMTVRRLQGKVAGKSSGA